MKSQSSLPIPYSTGSQPDISRGTEKNTDGPGAAQTQPAVSRTSFQTLLNENIIDIYERAEVKAAVPDERECADRRTFSARRQSYSEATSLQSGNKVTDSNQFSADQNSTRTEKTRPAIFSPSPDKGRLLDIWA